jgi:C1A family cysteine protease
LSFIAVAAAVPLLMSSTSDEERTLFLKFKTQYNKSYFDDRDESYRQMVFTANMRKIRQHNAEHAEGKHTYTMAMNEFGDLLPEEFHAKYTGFLGSRHEYARSQNVADLSGVKVADSIDWVSKGAVTPPKNQGQCGSCWSFSTTGAIEGAWYNAHNQLVSLSEQELMDCSKDEGNHSCEGGLMDYAFEWVIKKGGICSESDYGYLAKDEDTCKVCSTVASISSYKDVDTTEDALAAALNIGPVSVAIEADQSSFQFYSGGVLTSECGTKLDHGVLAVGYGEYETIPYWKVKNSWGGSWGMDGYILIQKGNSQKGGQCGILLSASYPVV